MPVGVNKEMESVQTQIDLYHTMFYVCLTLAVIFAIFAVLVFFLFRIKSVIAYMFGFSERLTTKKMEQANAKTGNLKSGRIDMDFTTSNLSKYGPNGLNGNVSDGSEETSRLTQNELPNSRDDMSGVSQRAIQPTMAPIQPVIPAGFHFTITENVMVIHTNELI